VNILSKDLNILSYIAILKGHQDICFRDMKRKIIKQGHNTLTITLPTEWTKKLNISAGDELEIFEKSNSLIINSNENPKEKSAVIDITNFTIPLIWRFFQGAYRSGCDEIKILFDPTKKSYEDAFHFYTTQFDYSKLGEKIPPKPAIAMVQGLVDRFIGMGIIETGKNYCVIREMGETSIREFERSLRRIFLVIIQMFDRVMEAAKKDEISESSLCKEIHAIDLNVDKFVDYCSRILNKTKISPFEEKKHLYFSTLYILELIGDEFKYIGKHLALSKRSVNDTNQLASMTKEHFEIYYKLFFKFDREEAIRLGISDFKLYSDYFMKKQNFKEDSRSIAKHYMMISKFTFVLAELRIEMEY